MSTSSPIFPENPTDGMIYEASPGVFFQYSTISNSWFRIFTADEQQLATSEKNGLMSSDDFNKLTGLILPPLNTTITPVETIFTVVPTGTNTTSTTYTDQTIAGCKIFDEITVLESADKFIDIEFSEGNIHDATAQIDIGIDVDALVRYLENIGQFRSISTNGDMGQRGDQGEPGRDALPVGPYGEDGIDGDPIWTGSLIEETVMVKTSGNKAIVNVLSDPQSDTENYLIVERGTIGNPLACPDSILPKDIQSPWLLVIKKGVADTSIDFTSGPVNMAVDAPTISQRCGLAGGTCLNDLFYFNIEGIIRDIYDNWRRQLLVIKENKETEMIQWLSDMSSLFEQQKAALCCALEAIISRKRNQNTRQYIETQAIAALAANRTIQLTGSPKTNLSTEYDLFHLSDSDCPGAIVPVPGTNCLDCSPFPSTWTATLNNVVACSDASMFWAAKLGALDGVAVTLLNHAGSCHWDAWIDGWHYNLGISEDESGVNIMNFYVNNPPFNFIFGVNPGILFPGCCVATTLDNAEILANCINFTQIGYGGNVTLTPNC